MLSGNAPPPPRRRACPGVSREECWGGGGWQTVPVGSPEALRRSGVLRNVKTGQAGAEASGTLPYPREGSVNLTFEILVTESWALA